VNLAVPRKNDIEMLLYIWKVIDLPDILLNDLLYKISFELYLFPPEKAKEFIHTSIHEKKLIKVDENRVFLSQELANTLKTWQKKRKSEISTKSNLNKRTIGKILSENLESTFNVLLKSLSDKSTLNRAATVSGSAFKILIFDFNEGMLIAEVEGSKQKPYVIEIDIKNKTIHHDCHDFQTKRAESKTFCKHLVKLFLLKKKDDEAQIIKFLEEITKKIEDWQFLG